MPIRNKEYKKRHVNTSDKWWEWDKTSGGGEMVGGESVFILSMTRV
jgi:hypothetical protein